MSEILDQAYRNLLQEIKQNFQSSQIKASVKVNSTLLEFYWYLGAQIVEQQKKHTWGSDFLSRLSQDLSKEFTDIKGFSTKNLRAIKQWYLFWQQAVAKTIENGYSRAVLVHQIEEEFKHLGIDDA